MAWLHMARIRRQLPGLYDFRRSVRSESVVVPVAWIKTSIRAPKSLLPNLRPDPTWEEHMTRDEAIAWLREQVPHHECEDCWYSCATICCDEHRRSDKCDCGADEQNAKRAEIAAMLRS